MEYKYSSEYTFLNSTGEEFDVRFSVEDNEIEDILSAHKTILSQHSPVFEAMLTRWDTSKPIIIPFRRDVFVEFLRFAYTGECNLSYAVVLQLLKLSHLYEVEKLFKKCKKSIMDNYCLPQNCIKVFLASYLLDTDLRFTALKMMTRNIKTVFQSEHFVKLPAETIFEILKLDDDQIIFPDEVIIYNACERWCINQCDKQSLDPKPENMQMVLGEAFRYIRFTLLLEKRHNYYDKCDTISNSCPSIKPKAPITKMLTEVQYALLIQYFGQYASNEDKFDWIENFKPRPSTEFEVDRFEQANVFEMNSWVYRAKPRHEKWDRIGFSSDKDILIRGIGYYGRSLHPSRASDSEEEYHECIYDIKLEIMPYGTGRGGRVMGSNTAQVKNTGKKFRVNFTNPVHILAGTKYIIASSCKGPRSYFGKQGRKLITVNCENYPVTFKFVEAEHSQGTTATGVNIGVIPTIYFSIAPGSDDTDVMIVKE